jgi:hypothetical protein
VSNLGTIKFFLYQVLKKLTKLDTPQKICYNGNRERGEHNAVKIKLDYKIDNIEKRLEIVKQICEDHEDELTPYNLEQLGNYLLFQMEKEERKERKILTPNRMVTVNKRETSFEGVVSKFEKNKDGIYGIMNEDKNVILSPKVSITAKDIAEIPFIAQIRESIKKLRAIPDRNYIVQQAIIDLSQTQYIIKDAYLKPIRSKSSSVAEPPVFDWYLLLDFKDWNTVKAFLHNYSKLKTNSIQKIQTDMFWILQDFEKLADKALQEREPMLYDIMTYKIMNMQNKDIQKQLEQDYGRTYSVEYISSLYNNKIPKLIAAECEKEELLYHYTFVEKGNWKKCNRCGQVKLLHSIFFSKNSSSSNNGFYSICKECRNSKKGAD